MSSQGGVFYFDQRPVPEAIAERLIGSLDRQHADECTDFTAPGLFMAHAATWIDDLSIGDRQPRTSTSGTSITFDGRLDNREDLLMQLRSGLSSRADSAL